MVTAKSIISTHANPDALANFQWLLSWIKMERAPVEHRDDNWSIQSKHQQEFSI